MTIVKMLKPRYLATPVRGERAEHSIGLLSAALLLCLPTVTHSQTIIPAPQSETAPPAADQTEDAPTQWTAAHAQSTFTEQFSPGFSSQYRGPQSLPSSATGRETLDVTGFFGIRPWSGAEIWWNPEVDQGFGIGNTFGVAGYISGEAYKLGDKDPYLVQQRLFLRQTIDLGGDRERIDPDINQLGGYQTANRLVVTLGKFSVGDVFDTNSYAHDPRNDFLNWSVIDQGSFDYAANSWGYTYGAAAELYEGRFAYRIGTFNLSNEPNAQNIDPRILGQFQLDTEIEERHTIARQPGKIKLLYWLSRGELGSYDDAIALAKATGTTPVTAAVRSYKTKDGVELNVEQQIVPSLGVFLRTGLSDGSVEEDDFSEINQSISTGAVLTGDRWHRPDDSLGTAFVVNQISRAAKHYLADGGLGGIIGDGALPNAGPEQIWESFYSYAPFNHVHVTADYELINHPAYNTDRGPVSVMSLRLHLEL